MGSTYTLLGSVTISTFTQYITFSSIDQSYTDLVATGNLRGNNTNFTKFQDIFYMQLNQDSNSIYCVGGLQWASNTVGGIYSNGNTTISSFSSTIPFQNAPTGQFAQLRAYFANYTETNTRKSGRLDTFSGFNPNSYSVGTSISWTLNTQMNAINRIDFFVSGGAQYWANNSTVRLYGINRNA